MESNNASPNQPDGNAQRVKRRPGGKPGNQNARKRQIYDKALTPEQRSALRAARRAGRLPDEINVTRIRLAALLTDPHADFVQVLRAARQLLHLLQIEGRLREASGRWD